MKMSEIIAKRGPCLPPPPKLTKNVKPRYRITITSNQGDVTNKMGEFIKANWMGYTSVDDSLLFICDAYMMCFGIRTI